MALAPSAGSLFFPLDEELGLLEGELSPTLQAKLIRQGTEIASFERAAANLAVFTGVRVSEPTTRRATERTGAVEVARVAAQAAEPAPEQVGSATPERVSLFPDGAMVPLLKGEWGEVKTLAIGVPQPYLRRVKGRESQEVECVSLSYFSRLTDWATFCAEGTAEVRRRGVAQAQAVSFGSDGASWCTHCAEAWCPEAVRFLDFPHAAEYVGKAATAYFHDLPLTRTATIEEQLHNLKHHGPAGTVSTLRRWEQVLPEGSQQTEVRRCADYLEPRMALMDYPGLQAAGWPIGTGSVESANKLVVEGRMKGPGMHWARHNVNPMLALRNILCSDRWETEWEVLAAARRAAWRGREKTAKPEATSRPARTAAVAARGRYVAAHAKS